MKRPISMVLVLGCALAARSAAAAGCKAEKAGLANAVKMRQAPMAQATATYAWAECERTAFEALKWPAKSDLKKMPQQLDARKKQLQIVRDAYEKAAATDAADARWKVLGALGIARSMTALVEQIRSLPAPPFKGSPDELKTYQTAYRDQLDQVVQPLEEAVVKAYAEGLELAGAGNLSSDAGVQVEVKRACGLVAQLRPTEQHAACGTVPQPAPPPTKPAATLGLPEQLSKSDISAGVAKVRSQVAGCAAKSPAKGSVKVLVKVSPNGVVASVTVKETPDQGLGTCVAAAMQKASFAKSQLGGTFSYPFTF